MEVTKEWLIKKFKITEEEADTLRSVGSMIGQTKSITLSFSTVNGRNRKTIPASHATDEQIQSLQLDINRFIHREEADIFGDYTENITTGDTNEPQGSLL